MSDAALWDLIAYGYAAKINAAGSVTKAQREAHSAEQLAAIVHAKRQAAHQDILCGRLHGKPKATAEPKPRRSSLAKVELQVARERLKARALASGVPMPKGTLLTEALKRILAAQSADIRAEALGRISSTLEAAKTLDASILGATP